MEGKWLKISDGTWVLVDDEDYPRLQQFHWYRGGKNLTIMRSAGGGRQMMTLGRDVMGVWPNERLHVRRKIKIDDFRKTNLEVEIPRDRGKMPRGVHWHIYSLTFRVAFQFAKKRFERKGFKSIDEAVAWRDKAIAEAVRRFPDWPPLRNGETRGIHEPISLAERQWRAIFKFEESARA